MTGRPRDEYAASPGTQTTDVDVELTNGEAAAIRNDLDEIARTARTHLTDDFTVGTTLVRTAGGPKGQVTVGFPTGETMAAEVDLADAALDGDDGPIPADEIKTVGTDLVASIIWQWRRMADERAVDGAPAR